MCFNHHWELTATDTGNSGSLSKGKGMYVLFRVQALCCTGVFSVWGPPLRVTAYYHTQRVSVY